MPSENPIRICLAVLALGALVSVTAKAHGDEQECALSYETFETAIPHLDAETCPDASYNDKAFCRISVGGDHAHVFYFSNQDKQCLIKVESYDDDDMTIDIKKK